SSRNALTAIRIFAKSLLVDVDVRVTERREVTVNSITFVLPLFHLFRRQLVACGRVRKHVDDILRCFIRRVDDHVAHRTRQLRCLLDLLIFEPAMRGDEVKEFDDAGGINSFIPAKTRSCRTLRVTQVNQRNRELAILQLLIRKSLQGCLRSPVNKLLQRTLLSRYSSR